MKKLLYTIFVFLSWLASWSGAMSIFKYHFTHNGSMLSGFILEVSAGLLLIIGFDLFLKKGYKLSQDDKDTKC